MPSSERPTVYVPIEIKVRELDSQLLLAERAAAIGLRTYIGSKRRIHETIVAKPRPGGVYLYKGTQHAPYMEWLQSRCDAIAVLDQEMSPNIREIETAIPRRFFRGTQPLVDRYFAVGPRAYRAAKSTLPDLRGDVVMTGWPRIDLWGDVGKPLYRSRAEAIRGRIGTFLLFVSDFGVTSESMLRARLQDRKSDSPQLVPGPSSGPDPTVTYRDFVTTTEILRRWDADPDVPPIVVRPHPADDHAGWHIGLRGLSKTSVAYEGDIGPWIAASQGIIHRGCTSALQAHFAGEVTYHLTPAATDREPWIQYYVSDFEVDRSHPPVEGRARPLPADARSHGGALMQDSIHEPAEGAASTIAAALAELAQKPEPPIGSLPSQGRMATTLTSLRAQVATAARPLRRRNLAVAPVTQKMPGGIRADDVLPVMEALGFGGANVRSPHRDLWEVNP